MYRDENSIFDVVHSLPVLSYSVAVAQRTPAAGCDQQTKFMPDYGGYLETNSSNLKNNALASGIPFHIKPQKTSIKFGQSANLSPDGLPTYQRPRVCSCNDCLIVTSYPDSDRPNDLSVIRLLGSEVVLSSLTYQSGTCYNTQQYACICSKKPTTKGPSGLKHISNVHRDYLLIKFSKSVKIHELNRHIREQCDTSQFQAKECDQSQSTPNKRVASISDRTGYLIKDASLNPITNNILAIASDNSNVHSIKLFDLSANVKQSFMNIEWATLGNEFPSIETCSLSKELRGRIVRTFIPMRPTNWGTQQLDHIPSHMFNLLVTNEHRVALVDPRSNLLAQSYLTKAELPSFYPIEYLRRTVFSSKNDYQFYSMTNVHLRVIDTRYPGVPMAQVGHMLDSDTYNHMDMKLIDHPDQDLETLCCSSSSRLSLMTFDQTRLRSLVNPRSTHLPYHDASLNVCPAAGDLPAFGLSAVVSDNSSSSNELFSIYQLSSEGDLLVRSFPRADEVDLEQHLARVHLFTDEDQAPLIEESTTIVPIRQAHELPDRIILEDSSSPSPEVQIDLLNSNFLHELENKLESKRAQEKYQLMKNKLCRS